MTKLDKALQLYVEDDKNQASYYDLILNSDFYIPVYGVEGTTGEQDIADKASIVPLVLSVEEIDYLMLFENKERLLKWADESVCYVIVSGGVIAQMTPDKLNWALNVSTEFQKKFVPEEIAWLKEMVEKCAEIDQQYADKVANNVEDE